MITLSYEVRARVDKLLDILAQIAKQYERSNDLKENELKLKQQMHDYKYGAK